jgi:dTDP-4-dehydrorhamnose 3,5-epimerase
VLHDLRIGSPTEGATLSLDLVGAEDRGLFIPPGVAHGFASLTDVLLWYLVDNYYNPADELGVAWDDAEIAGDWGLGDPVLSARDQKNPSRAGIDAALRPRYGLRT